MSSIELTEEQMEGIYFESYIEGFDYEIVHQSKWIDEGKMDSCEIVFLNLDDGKHYSFGLVRSGDAWKGYEFYYDDNEAVEVEKVKVVKEVWIPKVTNGEMKNNG